MRMEHWWKDTGGKTKVFGGKTCRTSFLRNTADRTSNLALKGVSQNDAQLLRL